MTEREMTLQEWVERLPEIHTARREYNALRSQLANTELELTHATKTCAEQQWRAEQAQARLAVAEQTLKAHGIHVEEKWCWCGPTVEKHDE